MKNQKLFEGSFHDELLDRREIVQRGVAAAGAAGLAFDAPVRAAAQPGGRHLWMRRAKQKR
jgi:hypothetical protein